MGQPIPSGPTQPSWRLPSAWRSRPPPRPRSLAGYWAAEVV